MHTTIVLIEKCHGLLKRGKGFYKVCTMAIVTTLICATLGCNRSFPQSRVYQNTDLKALIFDNAHKGSVPVFYTSFDVSSRYVIKDCEATIFVDEKQREVFLHRIVTECTNGVAQSGGYIIGSAGSVELGDQQFTYRTATTEGQIRLYTTEIDKMTLKATFIIFESRK